jgi:hypothetical protein
MVHDPEDKFCLCEACMARIDTAKNFAVEYLRRREFLAAQVICAVIASPRKTPMESPLVQWALTVADCLLKLNEAPPYVYAQTSEPAPPQIAPTTGDGP